MSAVKHKITLVFEDQEPAKENGGGNVAVRYEFEPPLQKDEEPSPACVLAYKALKTIREAQVSGPGTPTPKERARTKLKALLGGAKKGTKRRG
jgi:hypothetical protein